MKILTTNFLTCAIKACKATPASFPLHFKDAELARTKVTFNPLFIRNILPRIHWNALQTTAGELGLGALVPERDPVDQLLEANEQKGQEETKQGVKGTEGEDGEGQMEVEEEVKRTVVHTGDTEVEEEVLRKLHGLLVETAVTEGKLVCGNCGFEYPIKEGVPNFLLPAHLV